MSTLSVKTDSFLAQQRIAVAGVSRTKEDAANAIFRKLRDNGYDVFPVNPKTETFEDVPCYPNVQSIPDGVDGVVIVTRPEVTDAVVRDCAEAGVPRVWMHRSFGDGSVSEMAVQYCQEHGIEVIDGACPMMYCNPDFGHRCMKWILGMMGGLPK
jgi:predicted CoA-binding protein